MFLLGPSVSCGHGRKAAELQPGSWEDFSDQQGGPRPFLPPGTAVLSWPEPGGAAHDHHGGISGKARALRESTSPPPLQPERPQCAPCVLLIDSQDARPHILFSAIWVFVLAEPGSRSRQELPLTVSSSSAVAEPLHTHLFAGVAGGSTSLCSWHLSHGRLRPRCWQAPAPCPPARTGFAPLLM